MKNILKVVSQLNTIEKKRLISFLEAKISINIIDSACIPDKCVCCGSTAIIRIGYYKTTPRFRCKSCNKRFNTYTGTSLQYLHNQSKRDFSMFIELTLDNRSIRYIADRLNKNIQTIFNWRHKLLSALNDVFTKEFKGFVEMDDVLIRFNQKGRVNNFKEEYRLTKTENGRTVKYPFSKRGISNKQVSVLLSLDRYKTIDMRILKQGKININSLNSVMDSNLVARLNSENVIITDACRTYKRVFDGNYTHKSINLSRERHNKTYHINTLNNCMGSFKAWMKRFSSVATKYLQNYLNYFMLVQFVKNNFDKTIDFLNTQRKTYSQCRTIENRYQMMFG